MGKSPFLMGKSTISMAMFNSFLYVYQRVIKTLHFNMIFTLKFGDFPVKMICCIRFCAKQIQATTIRKWELSRHEKACLFTWIPGQLSKLGLNFGQQAFSASKFRFPRTFPEHLDHRKIPRLINVNHNFEASKIPSEWPNYQKRK